MFALAFDLKIDDLKREYGDLSALSGLKAAFMSARVKKIL